MRVTISATPANRRELRTHAREAMASYSPLMTWLLLDADGSLWTLTEPQGQTSYVGRDTVIAETGSFYKAHGDGAASYRDERGRRVPYRTQRHYLTDLLGEAEYLRIFGSKS